MRRKQVIHFFFKADRWVILMSQKKKIASDSSPEKKKKKEEKEKKEKRDYIHTIQFFLLFLHESRILIFIKNNMKNIKYILTVRSNSV